MCECINLCIADNMDMGGRVVGRSVVRHAPAAQVVQHKVLHSKEKASTGRPSANATDSTGLAVDAAIAWYQK